MTTKTGNALIVFATVCIIVVAIGGVVLQLSIYQKNKYVPLDPLDTRKVELMIQAWH